MINFKNFLNTELKRHDLNFVELGKLSGVSSRLISYYAKGQRQPSIIKAERILNALGKELIVIEKT